MEDKIRLIKILIMDVDGVLTDGHIHLIGNREVKSFWIQDGMAVWMAKKAGLVPIIISGRDSKALKKRAKKMNVKDVYTNRLKKADVLEEIMKKFRVTEDQIAYIGDDFIDLEIMQKVGFAIAAANAVDEIKHVAHYVTKKRGGHGAVQEAVKYILDAQGKWQDVVDEYSRDQRGRVS